MKFKTTQKAIKQGYNNVICVSYCALQRLLSCESEIAYTTRAEGWGADIYQFGNTAIVTGYAPFGNIRPGYELCQRYEKAAEQINGNYVLPYSERKEQLRQLINAFIEEVTQ
jgi:hypothetical protein